jgi:hypothetical protein
VPRYALHHAVCGIPRFTIGFLLAAFTSFAFLAMNDFGAVLDAFPLVWFGLLQAPQVRRDLADKLLSRPSALSGLLGVPVALIPFSGIDDRMENQTEHQVRSLRRCLEADTADFGLFHILADAVTIL